MQTITIERLGIVSSTNTVALERAGDVASGTLFLANGQSAGRGTRGRSWTSPAGEGIFASLVVSPPHALVSPATLSIAAGLSVHTATAELGLEARLKWPNDLLVGSAKLAGILVERRGEGPYVVGLGWNVRTRSFPPELEAERAVTSLACEGLATSVAEAERALVRAFERWIPVAWSAPNDLLEPYLGASGLALGAPATARGPAGQDVTGLLTGFGFATGAVLETEEGSRTIALEHCRGLRSAHNGL